MDAWRGRLRVGWLPATVLAGGLVTTALAGLLAQRDLQAQALREFRFAASEIQAKLEDRIKDHEQVLWDGAGLLDAAGEVDRGQWRAWVERSSVQRRLPGLEAISYVALVPGARLQRHLEAVRQEGFPGYRVWPEGARDAHGVVLFIEPFSGRNLRAFGFDDLSDPVRREALERARDQGVGAISGRIRLVQETGDDAQAGALMVVPVYRRGAPRTTVQERRAALTGWVVGAYRMGDLMHGILGGWEDGQGRRLRLALYDGERDTPQARLYDSAGDRPAPAAAEPEVVVVLGARAAGRSWTLRFSGPAGSGPGTQRVWVTLLLGAAFSLLLAALVASLQAAGRSAGALARRLGDEVRSSRQWLDLAIEAGNQGLWEWDAARDEVRFNERCAAMLGCAPGELDGPISAWLARLHPDDRPEAVADMERQRRGEVPALDAEYRVRHRDGGWVWVLARGRVMARSAGGAPLRAAGVLSDITALKQAHQAVQESEARFRRTADTAPVMIWAAGTDARCDYFNRPWLDFTGRELAQEVGDGWAEGVHPDDLARCLETYRDAFQARRPFSMEYRLRRHDGEHRWVVDNGVPRFGPDGAFAGYTGACADVTEMRRAQQALQQTVAALRRVEAAVEQAPAGIVITDAAGRIEYVNPAFERTTGYSRAEAVGQTPRLLKSDQHDDAFYAHLWATISAGRVWEGKIVNRTKAGALITEQVVIAPIKDGGVIRSYVAVKRDVSLELSLEQQLLQAQKLESVGRLAGGVAHDFNNLLTVILGCSGSLLADLEAGRAADRGDVDEIRAAGERARDLTRQLLAFARKQVTSPVALDLNASLRGCEKLLRRTLGEDVELAVSLQPGLWLVRCDPGQVEQVIFNLAINARDAMGGGGRLRLETSNLQAEAAHLAIWPGVVPGPYVRLAVHDSGAGIPEAIRDQIFEPFFTTKEVGQGTGLGLATVYGIVRQSGGFIRVDSEVGRGTTFEILLPRTLEARPSSAAPANPAATHGSEVVLLVEDDRAVRETVARGLRAGGYRVLEVASGAEALSTVGGLVEPPRLLVTDVVLPGMDGRALAGRLAQRHPGLRVLFTSGYARDLLSQRGVLDPDVEFLPKPFAAEDLLARVRAVLDRA